MNVVDIQQMLSNCVEFVIDVSLIQTRVCLST
jgi:hypothetical protein